MPFFRNFSSKFFGDTPPPIRPLKNVLPNGALTDAEVCYYLIEGSHIEQTRVETWLYEKKLLKYLRIEINKSPDIKEYITYAYDDAVNDCLINIRKGSFLGESSLNTYFYQIFNHKIINFFRQKATNKSKTEAEWYNNCAAAIEDRYTDFSFVNAIEPNELSELLDMFAQKEPEIAHRVRLKILGWKDTDFVEAKMAANENSARSYLSNCKTQFKQFLKAQNYPIDDFNSKNNGSETLGKGVKNALILIIYALRELFYL